MRSLPAHVQPAVRVLEVRGLVRLSPRPLPRRAPSRATATHPATTKSTGCISSTATGRPCRAFRLIEAAWRTGTVSWSASIATSLLVLAPARSPPKQAGSSDRWP
jgi:hypothetical protein